MLFPTSFIASSSDGSRTLQAAKLRLQKYLAGIPVAFSNFANVFFLMLANLLVFKSVTTKDRVLGSTSLTSLGIGNIL